MEYKLSTTTATYTSLSLLSKSIHYKHNILPVQLLFDLFTVTHSSPPFQPYMVSINYTIHPASVSLVSLSPAGCLLYPATIDRCMI